VSITLKLQLWLYFVYRRVVSVRPLSSVECDKDDDGECCSQLSASLWLCLWWWHEVTSLFCHVLFST